MKNRSINILIVALLLLAIMSVILITFLIKAKEDFPKDIRVKQDGVTETILPIRREKSLRVYAIDLLRALVQKGLA